MYHYSLLAEQFAGVAGLIQQSMIWVCKDTGVTRIIKIPCA